MFLFIIWIFFLSTLFIDPIFRSSSYLLIGIVLSFTAIYLTNNSINIIFFNKYLLNILPMILIMIGLSGLYGEFRIFSYLIMSMLTCWMGFSLGNNVNTLPCKSIFYPLLIFLISYFGVLLSVDQTYISIGSILLLVPWLIHSRNKLLFWLISFLLSFMVFSKAVILGLFLTFIFFNFNKKSTILLSILSLIFGIIIFVNFDQIAIFWADNIVQNMLVRKPLENSRADVWSFIWNNLRSGSAIFGQSTFKTFRGYSAHSGYFQAYIKMGIPGLILLILIPFSIIKNHLSLQSFYSWILITITSLYFIREIFVTSITENTFYMAGLYWFMVGILFRKIELQSHNKLINLQ